MGSLFHSVTLQPDETITITKYQAKRTQKIENYAITYHYALQVPDGLTYHPLEITFMNRLVWAFNWSYLDNLVATQGVNESYEIVSALKFWRSRFLILPAFKDTTRRLVDSLREAKAKGRRVHCDVYETPLASIGYEKICDKFITFLESLNRIRRTSMSHRVKQRHPTTPNDTAVAFNWADAVDPQRACHDTVTPMSTVAPPSNLVRRHGTVATPTLELERAVVSEDGTHSAAATPVPPAPLAPPHSTGSLSSTSISASASPALPLSTYSEIWRVVAAILDPECGLTFITGTPLLPKHTFCAYDFTTWLSRNLVDISSVGAAVKYAQSLLNGGYICHASGNRAHKFLNGFFLYTILAEVTSSSSARGTSDLSSGRKSAGGDTETAKSSDIRKIPFPTIHLPPSSASPLGSFSTDFQKEWIEVLVVGEAPAITHPITSHPRFASTFYPSPPSSDELETHLVNGLLSTPGLGRVFGVENTSDIHVGSEGVLRKRVTRDLRDTSITTSAAAALKRHPEWYCLLYDLNYHPTCAFGLEIQWLVASASRLNEMLLLYIYYKATSPGFHIVPSPCYPFGYSGTRYSLDPLRLPIFVPCRLLQLIPAQIDSQTTPQNLSPCAFAAELFPELPEPERMIALFYFQERILSKFGFIPLSYSPAVQQQHHSHQSGGGEGFQSKRTLRSAEEPPKGMIYTQRMFVHVSGGMFAMIPLYPPPPSPAMNIENEDRLSDHSTPRRTSITVYPPSTCSYATTLCSDTDIAMSQNNCESTTTAGRRAAVDPRTSCFEAQTEVGFFWAWNHMLPRKWRGQTTGDEVFQVGMLEDFRTFCSGGDGKEFGDRRLLDTFNKFKATLGVSGGVGTPSS
ncbi:GATOR complex protein DEPDC5 [Taenia crassiceps]|uniref:GATOR complex protein DEPDC5 n=1 Tax=Taenia crassiceps TaxID=6207 RepID=A0ABR4QLK8_9CEST